MTRTAVIYVLVNSLVLTFERTLSATLLFDLDGHSIECLFLVAPPVVLDPKEPPSGLLLFWRKGWG